MPLSPAALQFPGGVRLVKSVEGAHFEPPLEEGWAHLTKLEWWAASVEEMTGITVAVQGHGNTYSIHGECFVLPAQFYEATRACLTAFGMGVRAARWKDSDG